jgi:hypothetical protein
MHSINHSCPEHDVKLLFIHYKIGGEILVTPQLNRRCLAMLNKKYEFCYKGENAGELANRMVEMDLNKIAQAVVDHASCGARPCPIAFHGRFPLYDFAIIESEKTQYKGRMFEHGGFLAVFLNGTLVGRIRLI